MKNKYTRMNDFTSLWGPVTYPSFVCRENERKGVGWKENGLFDILYHGFQEFCQAIPHSWRLIALSIEYKCILNDTITLEIEVNGENTRGILRRGNSHINASHGSR